jgi:hypothetical protein
VDFFAVILFMMIYVLRPQDWSSIFESIRLVWLTMALSVLTLIFRDRGFSPKTLLKTPHDWAMLAYLVWILFAARYWRDHWEWVKHLFLFYVVITQALFTLDRIKRFLAWWMVSLFIISLFAIGSEYGFDFFDSHDSTVNRFHGRLALHLSNSHNPNELGHCLAPLLAMVYFFCVWKRPIFMKQAAIPLLAIPMYCIYLTLSKGSYLCTFGTLLIAWTFNRPKPVQLIIYFLAFTLGWAGLNMLPRMEEMRAPSKEKGIAGRIDAFRWGLAKMKEHRYGIGIYQFPIQFLREEQAKRVREPRPMSPHCSYVGVGTELGWGGLFMAMGVLYTCLRTLIACRTGNTEEERVRRILFTMVIAFMVSNWMINWSYSATWFILAAVTRAFHLYLEEKYGVKEVPKESESEMAAVPKLVAAVAGGGSSSGTEVSDVSSASMTQQSPPPTGSFIARAKAALALDEGAPPGISWRRIGLIDIALIWVMTDQAIRFWAYTIKGL